MLTEEKKKEIFEDLKAVCDKHKIHIKSSGDNGIFIYEAHELINERLFEDEVIFEK